MHPVETYLYDLYATRQKGAVAETSYYGVLQNLLNEIGKGLKPAVRAVLHPASQGAGIPDMGLFTADQLKGSAAAGAPLPARGVVEVKGTGDEVTAIAATPQVQKYLDKYGQVLVTNYRDFVLVGRDAAGKAVPLEAPYRLAGSELAFWGAAANAPKLAAAHAVGLVEYLNRVLLYRAALTEPRDVAWFLASYAREAKALVEQAAGLPALGKVRAALEGSLGIAFTGERGDHFFRSTLVQTLFYGIFSAWVLWSREQPPGITTPFNWHQTGFLLRVPMMRGLFEQVGTASKLRPLGLVAVLDRTAAALNRVDRAVFFTKFAAAAAVQYFYEPFLEAFDPALRRELGVWYTPPEIVRYQVARVDRVLREELGIADGLADPNVVVLDPACGTGAYLVETLRHIYGTLEAQYGALAGAKLREAAISRVFGFEILPAPFVVAHLQLGLLLQTLGAPLDDAGTERAGVYLTNALTGWEPPDAQKEKLVQLELIGMPELQEERDAAGEVKRQETILVILGNPPYNGFAGLAVAEERGLSNAYRTTKHAPAPQGQGLNDLYIRFYRMAERRIVEQSGRGVVCFISNYSWLDGLSFTGMRERYLEVFDQIWIDNLNGDKYKTGKQTPAGDPDPSVFSTDTSREGIQVGIAIALLICKGVSVGPAVTRFRNLWGRTKRTDLLTTLQPNMAELYQQLTPPVKLGLPFTPAQVQSDYLSWPLVPDLLPVSFPGVKTSRDDVVVDIDRDQLVKRMQQYFDPSISDEAIKQIAPGAMENTLRFNGVKTRDYLRKRGFLSSNVVQYCYRPLDSRWVYWEPETKLLDEKRTDYFPHIFEGNLWIEARQKQAIARFDRGYVVKILADNFGNGLSNYFPLYLSVSAVPPTLFGIHDPLKPIPNLSQKAAVYIAQIGVTAEDLFYHMATVLNTPLYRAENAGALVLDWPRIPLPATADGLRASATLGRQVAALLDPDQPVPEVTVGPLRPELAALGRVTQADGATGPVDLAVTVGWGHPGREGVTMPGRGRAVERATSAAEAALLPAGAAALWGDLTLDIYLNPAAYWRNVPSAVWDYTIGGYQVIKKWLSYRERALLGRPLLPDEAIAVTGMVRRLAALLLLAPALDANYAATVGAAWAWTASGDTES